MKQQQTIKITPASYGISHEWEPAEREWASCAEARNVRAGGADPPRSRRNVDLPATHN